MTNAETEEAERTESNAVYLSAFSIRHSAFQRRARPRPGRPAAQHRVYLALLPSGPDAVRRLNLHRVRTAVRRVRIDQCTRRREGDQARAGPHPVILGRPLMPDAISSPPRVRAARI